ncbi:RsfA family transcriptional regulator [Halobacillus litoralis]|uniref:RsfA family transcriptional regulator n=1 Tax=Halobacillus litoralis TaxID=45668 RepID=A0A410MHB8_9BACI|nr:RsfA family transcriptional regulator [Halobacillus litoralis]QAS54091.1 RsfA family transcriptional regulator [Halobacillus litoralis]
MPKVRQDAWSHEDDLLLAETVLRHIREGSTQLLAFEEVGDILNRTSAACGFRWNAEVRQKYEQAVELAKKQRKEKKRNEAKQQPLLQRQHKPVVYQAEKQEEDILLPEPSKTPVIQQEETGHSGLQLEDVIEFLTSLQQETTASGNIRHQFSQLELQNQELLEQNKYLNSQLESMTEDYQALIHIMDRARKMVMFDEQDQNYKPQFRMEKNGNLENVAR